MRIRILRHANGIRAETPVPRLGIGVLRQRDATDATICAPGVCIILQGTKHMVVGEQIITRHRGSVFASSIDLPMTRSSHELGDGGVYVAASLTLDDRLIMAIAAEMTPNSRAARPSAYSIAEGSRDVLDAWDRYTALLDTPEEIHALGRPREQELLYRLMQSPNGPVLRQIAHDLSSAASLHNAIAHLRRNFNQTLPAQHLARIAGMSVPTFNRHFRAATSMSPLQYQKTLRLQTARQLMAVDAKVSPAAYQVGYHSVSQFSRDYAGMFGRTPKQDAAQLRHRLSADLL